MLTVETIRTIFMIVDIPNVETISSNFTVETKHRKPNAENACRKSKLGSFLKAYLGYLSYEIAQKEVKNESVLYYDNDA